MSTVLRDTGRAAGGALIFALPMLMTMEMWELGASIDRMRLVVLIAITIPMLMGLSHRIGFEKTRHWRDDLKDSLMACGIGAAVSLVVLVVLGAITWAMSLHEILGKIALQMVPAAIGALLARSQFVSSTDDPAAEDDTYFGELFLMAVGALFLGFNIAPTEETILISQQMTDVHAIGVIALSLAAMHGFVFAAGFSGGSEIAPGTPRGSTFVRVTIPGYAIAAAISLFVLWIFGRTDGASFEQIALLTCVLALPSSVGAAAARLIL